MIPARERATIIQSLGAGLVPSIGLQHIQVGRNDEVQALVSDLDQIANGGAACRFVVGRYGSGKTFFLTLIRYVALQRKFVVAQADITTERRLQGSGGQARALFRELTKNISTRARPDGGALSNLVERWIGDVDHAVREQGGNDETDKNERARSDTSHCKISSRVTISPTYSPATTKAFANTTTSYSKPPCVGSAASSPPRLRPANSSASAPSSTMTRSTITSSSWRLSSASPDLQACSSM